MAPACRERRGHLRITLFFPAIVLVFSCFASHAQSNEWAWMSGIFASGSFGVYGTMGTPAPANAPGGRDQPVTWTDSKGNLWLFGGDGFDSAGNPGYLNDLWEFSASTNEWTWIGGSSNLGSGFSQGAGVYGVLGTPAAGNIPPGRSGAVSWTDAKGNLWLFGGFSYSANGLEYFNDLWEYNPSTNEWAWMSGSQTAGQSGVYGTEGQAASNNVPGARNSALSWTDQEGDLWLFGGAGYDSAGEQGNLNDLWEFNPATSQWTWVSGANVEGQAAVPGTLGTPAKGNVPGARNGAVGWTDNKGNLWLFGGDGGLNDLWEYNPATNEWAWMSGTIPTSVYSSGQPGVYGTLQTFSAANVPGNRTGAIGWTDSKGNLWMFGGVGDDSTGTESLLNDLWEFNPSTSQWAWMGGSSVAAGSCPITASWCGQPGVFGTLQTPGLGLTPGGRYDGVSWTDGKGNFWLFGGIGIDELGNGGYLSDLWEFQPTTNASKVTATPTFSPGSGTYFTWQSVTISDTTPGATIQYLINGNTPAFDYSGPITVSASESIEAIASASGYANSNIATANYVANFPQAAAPTFSVASGTYATAQTVAISDTTPGATIYYAIGATPTVPSTVYSGPITVSSSETIQAMAVADGYVNSSVATAAYNIGSNPSAQWTWMGGSSTAPVCPSGDNCGQPGWYGTLQTPAATNFPEGRWGAVTWTDSKGNLWLFGGAGIQGTLNDLWKYNPSTAEWAWMAGSSTVAYGPVVGSGQPGVYGTLGTPAAGNQPGSRIYAVGWTDKLGKLWLFGGWGFDANGDVGHLNDLWEFDLSTNEWTWMGGNSTLPCYDAAADECWGQPGVYGTLGTPAAGNIPGGRSEATGWTDRNGNFWIYGGLGWDTREIECYLNDLWEFNPSTNEWTWWSGYKSCSNTNLGGWPGVYGTLGVPAAGNNPWSLYFASSWTDSSGNLWLFGGMGEDTSSVGYYMNDMWEFFPSAGEWAWTSANSGGLVYGPLGYWSPTNIPGGRAASASWTDRDGNFWLLGGVGIAPSSASFTGLLNDLWEFKSSINEWAWMGGSNTVICLKSNSGICVSWGQSGVYGTLGTPASGNVPGARYSSATWTDSSGNLWLFGGYGDDAQGNGGYLNDLWQYSLAAPPAVRPATPAAMPSFSLAAGTYASAQTLTLSDNTPGAVIYYTTDGTMPNADSTVYNGQIAVSTSETVAAIAVASNYAVSAVATATYTLNLPPAATPTFSVAGGTYTSPQTVTITDTTSNATIYYTTNGNTPTASSTQYNGAITVSSTEFLQAIAVANGYINSAIASAEYTINLPPPTFTFSASPTSLTVYSGAQGVSTLTVTPQNGFSSAVSFACSGLPAGATCSFSPTTVTPSGAAAATQLTITVSAQAMTVRPRPGPLFPATALAAAVCIFVFRRRRAVQFGMALALVFAGLGLLSSCGGGGSGGGGGGGGGGVGGGSTPVTSTVTVTATSGSIQQTATVTLTVN